MIYCNQCGQRLTPDEQFCTACGAPIPQASAPVPPPPEPTVYGTPPAYSPPPAYSAPPAYGTPPAYRTAPASLGQNTFVNSFLSVIVLAAFFIIILPTAMVISPYFLTAENLSNILFQIATFGAIAFAVAVSARAKGPDLSIGAVIALSSCIIALNYQAGSLFLGICLSLLVCAVIGVINGAITTYLRAPAIIVTLLTGAMIRGICYLLTLARPVQVGQDVIAIARSRIAGISVGALVLFFITLAAAFLAIMLTKLGTPTHKRDKKPSLSYMFAYMISALFASLIGLLLLAQYGIAQPNLGTGYEIFILFVFACLAGSRVMDNRFAPAVYAIAPAVFYAILNNMVILLGVVPYLQTFISGFVALVFVAIAYVVRPKPETPGLR